MAQTGFTPIQIYRSSTASAAPTSGNLVAGELAINTADGKLFYLDNLNAVQVIGWKLVPVSAGGTGTTTSTGTGSVVLSDSPTFTTAITSTGALQLTGSDTVNQNIATAQTTGSLTIGGTSATGAITIGQSTGTQTVNIATGNNTTTAKSVNIGTGGSGSSATTIEIGTATGGATTVRGGFTTVITTQSNEIGLSQTTGTINIGGSAGTGAIALGRSTGAQSVSISGGATTSGTTKTVSIGTGGLAGSTTNINMGATASAVTVTVRGLINVRVYTVATLPTGIAGSRAFVSDALAPVFGSIVAGGGAVNVPVYYDGTNWRVG